MSSEAMPMHQVPVEYFESLTRQPASHTTFDMEEPIRYDALSI